MPYSLHWVADFCQVQKGKGLDYFLYLSPSICCQGWTGLWSDLADVQAVSHGFNLAVSMHLAI